MSVAELNKVKLNIKRNLSTQSDFSKESCRSDQTSRISCINMLRQVHADFKIKTLTLHDLKIGKSMRKRTGGIFSGGKHFSDFSKQHVRVCF